MVAAEGTYLSSGHGEQNIFLCLSCLKLRYIHRRTRFCLIIPENSNHCLGISGCIDLRKGGAT
jgi:hypothetical protein